MPLGSKMLTAAPPFAPFQRLREAVNQGLGLESEYQGPLLGGAGGSQAWSYKQASWLWLSVLRIQHIQIVYMPYF